MIEVYFDDVKIDTKVFKFSGGEVQVRLLKPCDRDGVHLRAFLRSSDDIMELFLTVDAIRQYAGMNVPITLTCPYLPYARQDRVCVLGEASALKMFCQMLDAAHFVHIEFWDVHNPAAVNLLTPWENKRAADLMENFFDDYPSAARARTVIVAPDKGAQGRARDFTEYYALPVIQADKKRDPNDGKILGMELIGGHGLDVDTDFLIVDDICDGGRTFIELAKILRPLTTGKILLYVTHGIFSAGFAELAKHIDHIYTPNPFQLPGDYWEARSLPNQNINFVTHL